MNNLKKILIVLLSLITISNFSLAQSVSSTLVVPNDINKNNVRDDVDQELTSIANKYTLTQPQFNSLLQIARSYQYILSIRPNTPQVADQINKADLAAINCATTRLPSGILDEVVGRIESKSLNTQEYRVVYDTYISLLSDSGSITNTPIAGCEDEYTSTNTGNTGVNNVISQNINMPCLVLTNFMEKNSTVAEVAKLQTFLTLYGYMSVWPTGFFGLNTESAVKTFQANNGIDVRGWAGPATRSKIAEITCKGDINAMATARRGVVVVAAKKVVSTTVKTTTPVATSNTVVIPETNINTAPVVVATNTQQVNTIVTTPKLSTNSGTFYMSRSPVNSIYFSYQNTPSISPTYICTERAGESNCAQGQNFREVSAIYDPTNFDMIPSGSKWLFTFYAQSNVSKAYFKSSINSPVEVFTFNYTN